MPPRRRRPPPADESQGRPLTRQELLALVRQLREAEALEAQRAAEADRAIERRLLGGQPDDDATPGRGEETPDR